MERTIFNTIGDLFYLLPTTIMFVRISCSKDCNGISGRSQILNAIVITTRYIGIFYDPLLKNTVFDSMIAIASFLCSYGILVMMFKYYKSTYNRQEDNFRLDFLIVPAATFGLFLHDNFKIHDVCIIASASLESVVVIPQYVYTFTKKQFNKILPFYIGLLVFYAIYSLGYNIDNLVKYLGGDSNNTSQLRISIASWMIQLIIYCNFFIRLVTTLRKKSQNTMNCNCNVDIPEENEEEILNENYNTIKINEETTVE